MIKFFSKYKNYIYIILIIFIVVFSVTGTSYLFGSRTDWLNQHTIIPEYFRQIFYDTGKILPNFALNYGGGQNIYNLSYYGFLSPIILFSYFFPFISMTNYIIIINIILVILSSILFYKFLKKHDFNDKICLVTTLLFTLSGPLIFHMHRHIMFVNYMPFLIMSLYGVDNFLYNNKKSLLILSVFLMIMTSYYYSVGGIVVCGIYFIYVYFDLNKNFNIKNFLKKLLNFIITIFISITMSSILLIPTIYTLFSGRSNGGSNYGFLDLLIPNLNFSNVFDGTYEIGLFVIGFIALIYLLYTKKKSNVIVSSLILMVITIPIFCFILNGGLYLREKCFIPFLPLIAYLIAYFINDTVYLKYDIKKFSIILIVISLFLLLLTDSRRYYYIFMIIFAFIFYIFSKYKNKLIIYIPLILSFFCICIGENIIEDRVSFNEYNSIFSEKIDKNIKNILKEDSTFYRMNNIDNPTYTVNKIYDNNYFTTNMYSSIYHGDYLDFAKKTFANSSIDYNYFLLTANKNLLFNSFMGVKYLYSSSDLGIGYDKINDNIYKNDLVFPVIYSTSDLLEKDIFDDYSYPYNIELLLNTSIVEKNGNYSFKKSNIIKNNLSYSIALNDGVIINKNNDGYILDVKNSGHLKIKLDTPLKNTLLFINLFGLEENSCKNDNIMITINGVSNILTCKNWIYKNQNNDFHFLINDHYIDYLDITFTEGRYVIKHFDTYIIDYDKLKTINDNKVAMNIDNVDLDKITGSIDLKEDGYLVTSIPYDKGFKIFVDGVESKIEKVNLTFLGTKINKGKHNIEILYESPGYNLGKFLSLFGFIVFFVLLLKERKRDINAKRII